MSPQFVPLTADRSKVFFDENGQPRSMSKCPECSQTTHFEINSNGSRIRFTGNDCGHAFEAPSPQ